MKENVNLCQCNNCESILIDQNPQVGARVFNVDLSNPKIIEMQLLKEPDNGGIEGDYFWGCPICETDGYFNDDLNEEQINLLTQ
jgi:hypothetical protein